MNHQDDRDLPLQPDPTTDERRQFGELSAWLDRWAAEAAERVPLPEERFAPDEPSAVGGAHGWPGSVRPRHVATGALAASLVGLLLLDHPAQDPPEAGTAPGVAAAASALQARDLEVASPRPYMIVPTRDPSISIVWLLDPEPANEGE